MLRGGCECGVAMVNGITMTIVQMVSYGYIHVEMEGMLLTFDF